jgi:hypothetical protein
MSKMKFSKFVSQSIFCLENGKLEFNLEWESLKKDTIKQTFCWELKKTLYNGLHPVNSDFRQKTP